MIAMLDPRMVVWNEEVISSDDKCYVDILKTLICHLEALVDRDGRLAVFGGFMDTVMRNVPFGETARCPLIAQASGYLLSFMTKQASRIVSIQKDDCVVFTISAEPPIATASLDDVSEQCAFYGLMRYIANTCPNSSWLMSFAFPDLVERTTVTVTTMGEVLEIRAIKDELDWNDVDLAFKRVDRLQGCTDAVARHRGYATSAAEPIPILVTPEFARDVEDISDSRVSFEEICESIAKLRYSVFDKGLNAEKIATSGRWRCYVNKRRGDRIEFDYLQGSIRLLRYYDPGEHDDFMLHS